MIQIILNHHELLERLIPSLKTIGRRQNVIDQQGIKGAIENLNMNDVARHV